MTASLIQPEKRPDDSDALPKGWRYVRIGEICEVATGGTPSTGHPEYYGGNIRWLKSGDVKGPYIFDVPNRITKLGLANSNARIHPSGSVMLAMSGQGKTRGTSAILMVPSACSQSVAAILPSTEAIPEIIYYALVYSYEKIRRLTGDNERTGLNLKIIRDIKIPLPPLTEQQRVVTLLNEQMAAVERARAAAEAQLEAAEALPAAYLRAVFNGPEVQKWPKERLGDVLVLRKEIVHPRDNPKGAAVFVGLEHIESGTGERIGSLNLEMSELTGRKPKFYKGDIVYGYLRPYLNKVWLAEFDGLCSVDQYVYSTVPDKADAEFISWFMRSPVYLDIAPIDLTPGQLPRIRTEEVATVELNLPPIDEQRIIAKYINEKIASVMQARRALQEQFNNINKLPAALLRQAINGEL